MALGELGSLTKYSIPGCYQVMVCRPKYTQVAVNFETLKEALHFVDEINNDEDRILRGETAKLSPLA